MKTRLTITLMAFTILALVHSIVRADEKEGKQGADEEQEQKVELDQLPAKVRDTLQREAGGRRIEEVEKETHEGKTLYSAEIEFHVGEDGSVVQVKEEAEADEKAGSGESEENEQEVTFDQLPAKVQEAIRREAKGRKIEEVEKETHQGKTVYGVEMEIHVGEDGSVVEVEEEENEEKEGAAQK